MSRNKTYIRITYENDRNNEHNARDRADQYAEEMPKYTQHRDVFNDRQNRELWLSFRDYLPMISGVDVITIDNITRKEFMKRKGEVVE